ncbi:fibronectin type III domain-containing protein [Actinoplanes sp. NEAU-A12]|uniref:Fibronectin type III domain-containing protein n=2 Tax=Actinoplanes sandaracinus TaxID=3045177 RepID=A0ABT6WNB1_9ACTN|nr:fibronectin type III domain-containing protein [Actinoplanes sandaracinus]
MAPPLAELTARAQTLSSAGDLAGARAVLDDVLRSADADPRRATADLAVAAALHARVLIALGDPESARLWAAFAHSAEERLHGPRDERTIATAAMHAAVLQRIGQYGRAASVYHDLVGELALTDGPDSPRVLAAEADLATAEHAAGHCATARTRLARAWRRHSRVHGDAAPAGIKMLARLGAMERECGHDAESREHLALAQELGARHLPTDHPLARQTAALVTGAPSGRHTCGSRDAGGGTPLRPFPRRPTVADTSRSGPSPFPADAPGQPPPDDRPTDPSGTVYPVPPDDFPDDRPPADNRATDPNGTLYQQPLYLSDLHRLPGDPTGRHARADTPPPLPGSRAPDYGEDGRPLPVGTARASTLADPPNSRRLPVRVASAQRSRTAHPLLLATVLAGGVATAAAVAILTLPGADGATHPQAPPSGPASAPAAEPLTAVAEPGAPQDVRLRDNGQSVSLQWAYPRDATGDVVIAVGRSGQSPVTVADLPSGATDYVVYSLSEQQNYCFTVSVRTDGQESAAAAPVCTRR